MTAFLDLVKEYDNFPLIDTDEHGAGRRYIDNLWRFYLPDDPRPHGYIPNFVVEAMPWTAHFHIDATRTPKSVQLLASASSDPTAAIAELLETARGQNLFKCLHGWRNEQYRILGSRSDVRVERAGAALFGIMTIGVHMTVYTHAEDGTMRLWVPQRSMSTATNPGMLDNSVAGGVPAGIDPLECLIKEAAEEASLPAELTRKRIQAAGCVTDFNIKDGGKGLLQPSVKYVYDMYIDSQMELRPADSEVEVFRLLSIEETKTELLRGVFKPMSAMVMVDFLIRHGFFTMQSEEDYVELVARTHRRLPFPTSPF